MKTLFRVLALGMLLTTLGVISGFAQEPDLETLFTKFKTERKAACGQRDAATATGKLIIEKFGADVDNQPVITYVKEQVALFEKEDPSCKLFAAYDTSYKAKDWAKFVSVSKEIMAKEGDSPLGFDVMLTLVSVGYNQTALAKVDTYNSDTINYAKMALQKLEANKPSQGKYGVFLPFKSKENAQSWMNYILGFYANRAAANDMAKKKEALAYFYKSTMVGTDNKSDVSIYTDIGDYYFTEAARLDKEYRDIRAANNNTETDEAKAKLGLARGYADRGIDAFGRARKVATENKATKKTPDEIAKAQKVIDGISKTLTDLYKFRFNLAPTAPTPDLDKYVSNLLAKPMPDPATDVTPVVEEVAPTTTTTTSTTSTMPATNTAATTTTTKPAATTTPAANTTTNKTTTPAKKPVTKKKGTR